MGVSDSVTGSGLQPPPQIRKSPRESSDEDEDGINQSNPFSKTSKSIPSPLPKVKTESSSHLFPSFLSSGLLKWSLGAITTLYILNQQHLLPKPLSAMVSKTLFWPTLPITVSRRLGRWSTVIDDTVVLGGAPFGFAKIPHKLHDEYNVVGVINMCEEYRGPAKIYDALGMEELWLPTTDHFEPSVNDMKKAVEFIQKYREEGKKVYIHCRAGHGRSAAITYAWILSQSNEPINMEELNRDLCKLRNVRKKLYEQPNVNEFRSWLKLGK